MFRTERAIVTAPHKVSMSYAILNKVYRYVQGADVYTTYEVANNFSHGINRPKGWLRKNVEAGKFDILVVVGYDGRNTKLIEAAEARNMDVYLIKES